MAGVNREGNPKIFACLGDSITSEQVSGIGTRVCEKLQMKLLGNFACGWASGSDWHRGEETLTAFSLEVQPNHESGFTREVAREHGEVHPDEEWAEKIAEYVAGRIRKAGAA